MKFTGEEFKKYVLSEARKIIKEDLNRNELEDKISEVDTRYIHLDEKRLEQLASDEAKAQEKEDFPELLRIRQERLKVINKLILAYKKKVEYMEQLESIATQEAETASTNGQQVFKNREIKEFKNEEYKKGQTVQLNTNNYELKLQKVSDTNQWAVLSSNYAGIIINDIIALPVEIKLGGNAILQVHRKLDGLDRYTKITPKEGSTLQNIKKIIKNPV